MRPGPVGFVAMLAILRLTIGTPAFGQQSDGPSEAQLETWRQQLRSSDIAIRATTIGEISAFGPRAAPIAPQLIEVLSDERHATVGAWTMALRNHARNALVQIGPAVFVDVLPALANDNR